MRVTWRISGNDDENKKAKSDDHELETALGTFKGKCNKCHVIGHKAANWGVSSFLLQIPKDLKKLNIFLVTNFPRISQLFE